MICRGLMLNAGRWTLDAMPQAVRRMRGGEERRGERLEVESSPILGARSTYSLPFPCPTSPALPGLPRPVRPVDHSVRYSCTVKASTGVACSVQRDAGRVPRAAHCWPGRGAGGGQGTDSHSGGSQGHAGQLQILILASQVTPGHAGVTLLGQSGSGSAGSAGVGRGR